MTISERPSLRLSAAAICAALLLTGCGPSRDAALSEKIARAERAAQRAEAAQKAAEKAAQSAKSKADQINSAGDSSGVPVENTDPDAPVDTAGADVAQADPSA